jgi:hypothetical protein
VRLVIKNTGSSAWLEIEKTEEVGGESTQYSVLSTQAGGQPYRPRIPTLNVGNSLDV